MDEHILTTMRFPFFSYEELAPWLTDNLTPREVENFLGHVGIYPQTLPTKQWQLMVIQAAWRVRMQREKSDHDGGKKRFIPPQILTISRSLAEAVSIFLDGCQPPGIVEIFIKEKDNDILLATAIAFEGPMDFVKGEKVGEIELDFGLKDKQKISILADELVLIPQAGSSPASLKIRTFGKARIDGAKKVSCQAPSGKVGIVIDSRGRPISLPTADEEGRRRLLMWQESFLREF